MYTTMPLVGAEIEEISHVHHEMFSSLTEQYWVRCECGYPTRLYYTEDAAEAEWETHADLAPIRRLVPVVLDPLDVDA